MFRVPVKPALLRWARTRSGCSLDALAGRFRRIEAWERGEAQPTLRQLEAFARATRTPVGFFFLAEPPEEKMPIADFRAVASARLSRLSVDLLDTIYLCQRHQGWYHDYATSMDEPPHPFVGSARAGDAIVAPAAEMRQALGFGLEARTRFATWTGALRRLVQHADRLGILTMVSGVVGTNSHRRLDPQEFRGFALADPLAPLVFVNAADAKAAQMFTLAHELAHIWLGTSGLSDASARVEPGEPTERWCSQLAAEFLVPLNAFRNEFDPSAVREKEVDRLARVFKVSTLVILRRIRDAGELSPDELRTAYDSEFARLRAWPGNRGRDSQRGLGARVSNRFATALVACTLEGRESFREAYHLLGVKKASAFDKLSVRLGMRVR